MRRGQNAAASGGIMALYQVNDGQGLSGEVSAAAAGLPQGAPVVVMIHGFRFSPRHPGHDPHRHILSLDPDCRDPHVPSWPRGLGLAGPLSCGLGIAFGWEARGQLRPIYHAAADVGQRLAGLIGHLSDLAQRPVAIVAHSLGARVALAALPHLAAGQVGRMILLAGAEFRCRAATALDSAAGRRAEVLNITSRENDLFDFGLELMVSGLRRQALGFGLARPQRNWVDIQIDDTGTQIALAGLGFPLGGQPMRLCHRSPYLRAGIFDFYRTALRQPWALSMGLLRTHLPGRPAPRWSRLLAWPAQAGGVASH